METKRDKICQNEYLFCPICESKTSACSGDYWQLDKDFEFLCPQCQCQLWLNRSSYSVLEGDKVILKKVKVKDLSDIV